MTDRPKPAAPSPREARPGIAHADVPSETAGQPGVGDGASAAHFARDVVQGQAGDGTGEDARDESHAPADPRDEAR